jgi:streptogramin lyase
VSHGGKSYGCTGDNDLRSSDSALSRQRGTAHLFGISAVVRIAAERQSQAHVRGSLESSISLASLLVTLVLSQLTFSSPATAAPPAPAGEFQEFTLAPEDLFPGSITAGPDGNMWFLVGKGQPGHNAAEMRIESFVARITPEGTISEFPLPPGEGLQPYSLIAGPQDSLWYLATGRIG